MPKKADHKERPVKLLLDWYPNPVHIPLYAGKELGFFQEEGIDLEMLKLLEPPSSIPYLLSGKVDVALYYAPQFLRAKSRIPSVHIIGKLIDQPLQGFCFLEDANIQSFKDFDQKRIGGPPDGANAKILQKVQEKNHIQIKDFKAVHFDLITALLLKEVDIVSGIFWNIEPVKIESVGKKAGYFSWSDLGCPSYPELIFLSDERFVKQRPDFEKRFLRALQKSIDFARENPENAFALYVKALPEKDQAKFRSWERKAWHQTIPLLPKEQNSEEERMQALADWMKELGIF
ncbi:MAG: hypothetical protein Tsb0015_02220 [Simkaniaceae bacterium]